MSNRYEKTLALLLRLDAILLLTALVPSMMPFAWMQAIHRSLGMGELAGGPLIGYLTRSLSVMYAVHGAVMLFVSLDVRRYFPVVRFIVVLGLLLGLWIDRPGSRCRHAAILDRLRRPGDFPV